MAIALTWAANFAVFLVSVMFIATMFSDAGASKKPR
jgi:hypothetical protein